TRAAIAPLLLLCGTSLLLAQETKSTSTGVFTEEQAKKGETTYQRVCASCHGADLHSTEPEAPDLTEGAFKVGWQGKTIAERFETIRNTMPPLDDATYLDILTYILRYNNVPAGTQALHSNTICSNRYSFRFVRSYAWDPSCFDLQSSRSRQMPHSDNSPSLLDAQR